MFVEDVIPSDCWNIDPARSLLLSGIAHRPVVLALGVVATRIAHEEVGPPRTRRGKAGWIFCGLLGKVREFPAPLLHGGDGRRLRSGSGEYVVQNGSKEEQLVPPIEDLRNVDRATDSGRAIVHVRS